MNIVSRSPLGSRAYAVGQQPSVEPIGFAIAPEQPSHVVHLLTIARRRKWAVIGGVLTALLLGLGITLLMTRAYTAAAMLEIQHEGRNFTEVKGVEGDQGDQGSAALEFY